MSTCTKIVRRYSSTGNYSERCGEPAEFWLTFQASEDDDSERVLRVQQCYQCTEATKRLVKDNNGYTHDGKYRLIAVESIPGV